jgi:triphosphoribosyl-dephospho-CoA synthase
MKPDIGLCVQLACIWEATARKPGNVHRFRDFDDLTYLDFLASAAAVAPVLGTARGRRPGSTVLACVRATRQVARTNANLGIILLLAPLASVPDDDEFHTGVGRVLQGLDVEDARLTYEAIRLANPGGLGQAPDQDVAGEPTQSLRDVMLLAADRDLVARQYANGYREVFDDGVAAFRTGIERTACVEGAIIRAHLSLMAQHPDTLIARKRGPAEAREAGERAGRVLQCGWPERETGRLEFARLDAWLRQDGHSRNPGSTADLITATLFVALREGIIGIPPGLPWSADDTFPADRP